MTIFTSIFSLSARVQHLRYNQRLCVCLCDLHLTPHASLTFHPCAAGETEVLHLTKAEEENEQTFRDKETGSDLEVQEKQSLLEWFANNYKQVHPAALNTILTPLSRTESLWLCHKSAADT